MKRLLPNELLRSQLARNTIWMFLGQGLQIVLQALYFVLIARALHAHGYGAFIGICAFIAIFSPFVTLGGGNLLIRNVARDQSAFGRCWGKALLMCVISSLLLLGISMPLSLAVLPEGIPSSLVFLIAITELFFMRASDISAQVFQAFQRLEKTAMIQVLPNILRLACIAALTHFVEAPTIVQWGYLYFLSTLLCSMTAMWMVTREFGPPDFRLADLKTEVKDGFYFSVSLSASCIYNDIDKTMLSRISTLESAGIYGAAYRIVDVSFAPVRSLLFASYAKFFQHGSSGIRGTFAFARTLLPAAAGYALLIGILLLAVAPLLPYVLGAEYANAAVALGWLSPLPFLRSIHYMVADSLTGAGFQGVRSGVQVIVAFFNVAINFWLIPAYSWLGAAWASIASDSLLAILMISALIYLTRKERSSADSVPAA